MAEDTVAIQPAAPAVTTTPVLIKTFSAIDANGQTVEIQAVALVDSNGRIVDPLTENTGRAILETLISINNILAESTGLGTPRTL